MASPWTPVELALLREHYPLGGADAVAEHLAGRGRIAIRGAAVRYGVETGIDHRKRIQRMGSDASRKVRKPSQSVTGEDAELNALARDWVLSYATCWSLSHDGFVQRGANYSLRATPQIPHLLPNMAQARTG